MGGIENFMADLMNQQVINGDNVSAIVHHHEKQQPFITELEHGSHIYRVPCYGQLAYAPIAPSFGYHLNNIINQEKPDVLHIHMPNLSAFWILLLPAARKVPWVIHWHADVLGSVPDFKIKLLYPFYQLFEQALLKRSAQVITTSSVYSKSSQPLKKFASKVKTIPLGLRALDGIQANVKNDVLNMSPQINLLIVGRLTYYKGHSTMLCALSKLKEQGLSFKLSIVGDGELRSNIEQQITKLKLFDCVELLGKLPNDELNMQLSSTDLLCLPSIERTEAFGVVLLEAMRSSKPCLVTDVPGSGMSWVVQDNETGFIVKHNNVDSLVKKLAFIAANRQLLAQYGKAGRKRFDNDFSIKSVCNQVTVLYNNATAAINF